MLTKKPSDHPTEADLLPAFLELLVEDMYSDPDRGKPIDEEFLKRSMALVDGVAVDLDLPLQAE